MIEEKRGKVRLLFDSYFDESEALRSNQEMVEYLATVAVTEGIDIYLFVPAFEDNHER